MHPFFIAIHVKITQFRATVAVAETKMNYLSNDAKWLTHALELAGNAQQENEVPVGAVVVFNNEIIGQGWNRPIGSCDPTAHAEIVAMRAAAQHLQNYRLLHTTLYVTLEPCAMCVGAIMQARVKRLVFGAFDPRAGAVGSVYNILQTAKLKHNIDFIGGVLQEECAALLRNFFQERR